MTPEFADWGWRVPFLRRSVLLGVSLWIRIRLQESPVFRRMKEEQRLSRAALGAFCTGRTASCARRVFGAVIGQAVTFYMAHVLRVLLPRAHRARRRLTVTVLTGTALAIGGAARAVAGWLTRPRRPQAAAARPAALAVLLYFPLFGALLDAANPALAKARADVAGRRRAEPADCSLQFDPMGRPHFDAQFLRRRQFAARRAPASATRPGRLPSPRRRGSRSATGIDGGARPRRAAGAERARPRSQTSSGGAVRAGGGRLPAEGGSGRDPPAARRRDPRPAPLHRGARLRARSAALLAEMFPARIRYTACLFPQNFGNGWFGGLLPAVAFTIVAATGNVFAGLWYPVCLAALCFVVGALGAARDARPRRGLSGRATLLALDLDLGPVGRIAHDGELEVFHVVPRPDDDVVFVVNHDFVFVALESFVQSVADARSAMPFLSVYFRYCDGDFRDDGADFR